MAQPPKKYIKVGGVMKMNPEYKRWQAAENGGPMPPPTRPNANVALPVVSSMDDYMQMNDDLKTDIPLSESTNATIEMMQEPEICLEAGMQADTMVDELGAVLGKYEVPMGLMNKVRVIRSRIYILLYYYTIIHHDHAIPFNHSHNPAFSLFI